MMRAQRFAGDLGKAGLNSKADIPTVVVDVR
jgi:hypothetical protein